MNSPMALQPDILAASDAFRAACELDVLAFKPGNVSMDSPGHGMTAQDFVVSARVAAPHVADRMLGVGERVYRAIEATRQAVACNTNLGIVLLAVPLIHAAQHRLPGETLAQRLYLSLSGLTQEDADWVYRAICLAAPGGLGEPTRHDVHTTPTVTLLVAMQEAARWDRIAHQYASTYADIFGMGMVRLRQGRARWGGEAEAVTTVYLGYLADFPDSHVLRKYGPDTAEQVRQMTRTCIANIARCSDWADVRSHLEALDHELKLTSINPGTSADLTVATWLADRLTHG
ncbi:triphosphoribosyl-dephospho-CoA synthase [Sulfuriferula plumbiphila]|uniref:Triphosphoribosyl-dephospho-CoA synthase n=1 Tax=Sulfuriferula plumbiphila TaxID=171865 RepID=A0A512L624_9PROT|nr:triphosphoribosyl-dephospho-CoA synthase [Sulfuriferula plumbiphila]BBP05174.1 triphosphoribosyl-dephospho-CoA synthase [Sulfuriferula plumbiphila]GEP29917.1 triphosphoribosyl-dephospho-CoA synthase [Sulfuriferula plumbiphila]